MHSWLCVVKVGTSSLATPQEWRFGSGNWRGGAAEQVQPNHVFMPSSDTSNIKYATTPAGSLADYVHVSHNHETGYIDATKSAPL